MRTVVRERKPKTNVMFKSDQGSQVTGREWQLFLCPHKLDAAMSRRKSIFQPVNPERIRRRTNLTRQATGRGMIYDS